MLSYQWWEGRESKAAIAMHVSAGKKTNVKAISLSLEEEDHWKEWLWPKGRVWEGA